jgi:hypothetical protein
MDQVIHASPEFAQKGFSKMEEIRRMGKLCDITLVVYFKKYILY